MIVQSFRRPTREGAHRSPLADTWLYLLFGGHTYQFFNWVSELLDATDYYESVHGDEIQTILCLTGPPGSGKSAVTRAIASLCNSEPCKPEHLIRSSKDLLRCPLVQLDEQDFNPVSETEIAYFLWEFFDKRHWVLRAPGEINLPVHGYVRIVAETAQELRGPAEFLEKCLTLKTDPYAIEFLQRFSEDEKTVFFNETLPNHLRSLL